MNFTIDQLVNLARMTQEDLAQISQCWCAHNKFGFGYQLSHASFIGSQGDQSSRDGVCDPDGNGINLKLMDHISPITWDNVILYGEYVLNRGLIDV